ncbi:BON domain-containing protein [Paraburkholderia sacchari]|uniref:BON domain-containing protein n=1 Tax=Paraburkholderia sacchari TaxID=159450 RepID=UPI001BD18723|nr:BON domain-containing protein [Paraburkholderia sacchari]
MNAAPQLKQDMLDEPAPERPATNPHSDDEIATMARAVLHWTAGVPQRAVEVEVVGGHLVLQGTVEWEWQRELAIRTLMQLRSVTGVTSRVTARRRTDPDRIGERIRKALQYYVEDEAGRIHAEMSEGVVTLRGKVGSEAERAVVRGAAWSQPGVRAVIDELVIV